jgi:hypothetical protein
VADWREVWRIGLDGLTGEQIRDALEICTKKHEWPPSPAEFRALCIPPIDHERLFIDAANALSTGKWPNPLTYWAAQSFGAYDLRQMSYPQAKARWIKIVDVMAAEHTLPNVPERMEALPAPGKTMSPDVAKGGLETMKKIAFEEKSSIDWARRPRSQRAVDLAIAGEMHDALADARKAGYVEGDRWISPERRKPSAEKTSNDAMPALPADGNPIPPQEL